MNEDALSGWVKKAGGSIRTAWLVLGVVFVLLLAIEAGSYFLLFARDTIKFSVLKKSFLTDVFDHRIEADTYRNADWVEGYYLEYMKYTQSAKWHSYVIWRSGKLEGKYINIDENGIRQTWNKNAGAEKEKFRIFMLGGSTTWGDGVRDDFTISSYLSRILSERGFNVEVVNFGETGYVSTQEVITLLLEIRSKNTTGGVPDVVIFYDGVNEVLSAFQNHRGGGAQNIKNRKTEFNLLKPWKKKELTGIFLASFIKGTNSYRFFKYLSFKITGGKAYFYSVRKTDPSPDEIERIAEEVASAYSMNIKLVEEVGKQIGFDTLFYWQPMIFNKHELTPYEKGWDNRVEKLKPIYKKTYELVKNSESLNSSERFHNISRIFENYAEPLYVDHFHISEEGNEIVAQRMAQDLSRILEARSRTK